MKQLIPGHNTKSRWTKIFYIMSEGNQLSFPTFKQNMEKQVDPVKTVIECAAFLRESKEIDNHLWKNFSQRFFKYYRATIMGYYGYEYEEHYAPRVKLNYPSFFISVMFEMQKIGIFNCKLKQLADTLHAAFYFTQKSDTIRNWFYEKVSDYEEELSFFGKIKDAGKLKK